MFCNFCGKNFEPIEGFEEVKRNAHHLIRCEHCTQEQREDEYDWRTEVTGRGHKMQRGKR